MKQKVILLIFPSIFFIACNNNNKEKAAVDEKNTTDSTTTAKAATNNETSECYINTKNKDSMLVNLTIKNNILTGDMNYQIAGKDKNKGTLQGEIRGDTIFADYTFMSEGKESVRQVAYLKKDNKLLEGYGDVEDKGGKMVFKNTGSLQFGKGVVLQKINCK